MKEYVLILPIVSGCKDILLVRKEKPEWQKGKLNLVGGSVEYLEEPKDAAIRELQEESGIVNRNVVECGKIVGKDFTVYCYYCEISRWATTLRPRECEVETVAWYPWDVVKTDRNLIPNLTVIIPLLRLRVVGWTIIDTDESNAFRIEV